MCSPNEIMEFQSNVRKDLDFFVEHCVRQSPQGCSGPQAMNSVAVELVMRAGLIMGVGANCNDLDELLKPVDDLLLAYQQLANKHQGAQIRIVVVDREPGGEK